jgi:hypothetical protein
VSAKWVNDTQFERDHKGYRNTCSACGHDGTEADPLVVDVEGWRICRSHTEDPNSGMYGTAQQGVTP